MKKKSTAVAKLEDLSIAQLARLAKKKGMTVDSQPSVALVAQLILPPEMAKARSYALAIADELKKINGRCLNDQVLVLRSDPKASQGVIIIPDSAQEKAEEGVVVAVGPGYMNDKGERVPLGVKPGDCVKFSKYYGTEVKVGGILFLQLHECEIEFAAG